MLEMFHQLFKNNNSTRYPRLQDTAKGIYDIRKKMLPDGPKKSQDFIKIAINQRSNFVEKWLYRLGEYHSEADKYMVWLLSNLIYRNSNGNPNICYQWEKYMSHVANIIKLFDMEEKEYSP